MSTPVKAILIAVLVVAAGGGGYWFGHRQAKPDAADKSDSADKSDAAPDEDKPPVASVATVPVRRATVSGKVAAFGSVIAQPGEVRVVSVPYESRVGHMLVTAGQQVSADAELVGVDPSPDTATQLQDARNTVAAAKRDLAQTQQRFNDRLATNQDLSASQQNLAGAQLKLDSLEKRGAGASQKLKAGTAGVVSKVDAQEGQIVPAGGPLVEVAVENRIEVKLGIEPQDVARITAGQEVRLTPLRDGAGQEVVGHVRLVTQRVNPDTRLVDVFVKIPPDSGLMLEGFVRGELAVDSKLALVVPREAVLPADNGWAMYTVENGKAVQHAVGVGLEDDKQVEVTGEGLKEGAAAVVEGNYELTDGMAVDARPADDATTQPTTAPAAEVATPTAEAATRAGGAAAPTAEAATSTGDAATPAGEAATRSAGTTAEVPPAAAAATAPASPPATGPTTGGAP